MSRRGGYVQNVEGVKWAKLGAVPDAQGKLIAASMGQSYQTWLTDAVAFHVHYCERFQLHQHRHDQQEAAEQSRPTISPHGYQPRSPKTVPDASDSRAGSAAGRSPSPTR